MQGPNPPSQMFLFSARSALRRTIFENEETSVCSPSQRLQLSGLGEQKI
ncbi:hypothetical protein PROFUN_07044 [Planoprotostelium fungivorum]|uniref:Uncharacterized protein n=1 Tax=Planoprotostelium fungivorum TaxID=1890364 RepID=A0A2P6NM46_9EUKA|nr:hypothetical protein PROFUN_07319 [Planoprotostelium fungivorum]PRP85336.1 hypothetical protein PROFUN_07044 [Planoprotostelium fungivorum]